MNTLDNLISVAVAAVYAVGLALIWAGTTAVILPGHSDLGGLTLIAIGFALWWMLARVVRFSLPSATPDRRSRS